MSERRTLPVAAVPVPPRRQALRARRRRRTHARRDRDHAAHLEESGTARRGERAREAQRKTRRRRILDGRAACFGVAAGRNARHGVYFWTCRSRRLLWPVLDAVLVVRRRAARSAHSSTPME